LTTKITKSTKGLNSAGLVILISIWWFLLCTVGEFSVIEVSRSNLTAKNAKKVRRAVRDPLSKIFFRSSLRALCVRGGEIVLQKLLHRKERQERQERQAACSWPTHQHFFSSPFRALCVLGGEIVLQKMIHREDVP
jgi:hypothetical protein